MISGDKVYISHHDIEACGYGDSVFTEGTIVFCASNKQYVVQYKDDNGRVTQGTFYEHELNKLT